MGPENAATTVPERSTKNVIGGEPTPNSPAKRPEWSGTTGQVTPHCATNRRAPAVESSMSTETSRTGSRCRDTSNARRARLGSSAAHGGHQLAKKLTTTTWPRSAASDTPWPPKLRADRAGAGRPTSGLATEDAWAEGRVAATSARATSAAATRPAAQRAA